MGAGLGRLVRRAARALTEFDRVLLYLLVLILFGSMARSVPRLRALVYGLLAAAVVVSAAGLVARLLPSVLPVEPSTSGRLDFPLTYENSVGLMAALGIVYAVYLATSHRQPLAARAIGAGAVPLLATTLLLTLARAGIVAVAVGTVA